jgi:hypothetical protein
MKKTPNSNTQTLKKLPGNMLIINAPNSGVSSMVSPRQGVPAPEKLQTSNSKIPGG